MSSKLRKRVIIGVIVFAFAAASGWWVLHVNGPLKTTCTKSIMPLEVAISVDSASFIVKGWKAAGVLDVARAGVRWDFLFILMYTISFAYFCWWSGVALWKHDHQWKRAGWAFMKAAFVAGILDVVENVGLLAELHERFYPWLTALKAVASMVKWLLIVLMSIYIIVSWALWIRIKRVGDRAEIPELLAPGATP